MDFQLTILTRFPFPGFHRFMLKVVSYRKIQGFEQICLKTRFDVYGSFKMAPRWPQDGPKMAPRSPKKPQVGPKMAQDGLKMAQMAPRWPRWPMQFPRSTRTSNNNIETLAFQAKCRTHRNLRGFGTHYGARAAPGWPQDGLKMAPRLFKMAPR